jgi:hypothetical protein
MGDLFPDDGGDPTDGFNRASISLRSRKSHAPKIGQDDFLTPRGYGNARMAGMCFVMAICLTLMYVWPVLFFVNFWVPLGHFYGGLLLAAIFGFLLPLLRGNEGDPAGPRARGEALTTI